METRLQDAALRWLDTPRYSAADLNLESGWSYTGPEGTERIDDGYPFRTSAVEGLPRYVYDSLGRRWEPYS
ncbi:hypothetical protein ACIQFU_38055 [Streptomyces sp. NPDC093065]|uniref:hypothetical protein n=1 Tax=Streptomyces sp. NPDC093065 TaxID=3366021 RepID=UPI003822325D